MSMRSVVPAIATVVWVGAAVPAMAAEGFARCTTDDGQGELSLTLDWPAGEFLMQHATEGTIRCAAMAQAAELCLTCAPPASFTARFFMTACAGGLLPSPMLQVAVTDALETTRFAFVDPRSGDEVQAYEACATDQPATPEALTELVGWPQATWDDPGQGHFEWQR